MPVITCSINTLSLQHSVPLSCRGIYKSSFEFSGIYWQFNISQTMHVSCWRTQHSAHIWVVYTYCLSSEILRVTTSTALTYCVSCIRVMKQDPQLHHLQFILMSLKRIYILWLVYDSDYFQWVMFRWLCIFFTRGGGGCNLCWCKQLTVDIEHYLLT